MRHVGSPLVAIIGVVGALAAPDAVACQCLADIPLVVPIDGAVDVVRDAKVWIPLYRRPSVDEFAVVDDAGAIVEGVWSRIEDEAAVGVFHPAEPLRELATYGVQLLGAPYSSFTTGAGFSSGAPVTPTPSLVSVVVEEGSDCSFGADHTIVATVAGEHDGAFLVADVDGSATFDGDALSGRVVAFTSGDVVDVGNVTCAGEWPGVEPGRRGGVRLGAIDVAGHFSGWSDEILVDIPADDVDGVPPGDCASAPAPLVLALGALLRLRSRGRRPKLGGSA